MSVKVFDLSSYLEEKKSTIKLGDEEFEISDGFNDLLKIDALSSRRGEMSSPEFVKEFLGIALGEESAKELLDRNYSHKFYVEVMNCIEKVYSGDDSDQEGVSQRPTLV